MPETKPFWKSKTLWFNLLAGVLMLVDQNAEFLQNILGENAYAWVAAVVAAGNAFLRALTNKPVAGTPAATPPDPKK